MSGATEGARARLACLEAERMAIHLRSNNLDPREFYDLCLSLARRIDYAVANGEVLPIVKELAQFLKQVCHGSHDHLRAAIMVLMISAKTACNVGWFSDKDKSELLALANEIGNCFCDLKDVPTEPIHSYPTLPKVMERFFPLMKMGQIIASLNVKPGYGAYIVDFHISKKRKLMPQEKICLFVAQVDNTETSACLVSPQQANFLINGKAVERRTNVFTDPGPQMPTKISPMLKYGTNLLQAVGQFNGNYVIVVAYMSMTSSTDISLIQDYVQPSIAAADIDSDIIEGPSRISLNCPLSFTRIQTPVKGRTCKHHQCFDFSNFVAINCKRPSWRCPHCNQHVCYLDIRIDQNVAKVLKEVGTDVVAVTITDDGSWRAVENNCKEKDKETSTQKDGAAAKESSVSAETLPDVLDLTGNDMISEAGTCNIEDRKPSDVNLQNRTQSSSSIRFDQNVGGCVGDAFYSGVYIGHGSSISSARSNEKVNILEPMAANYTAPLMTDAVSTMSNRGVMEQGNIGLLSSVMQNQLSDSLQLKQFQFPNSVLTNEHRRVSPVPRNVSRIPTGIQGLAAHSQMPSSQQRSRMSPSSLIPNGSSLVSQAALSVLSSADGMYRVNNNLGMQQQFSRSDTNLLLGSSETSSMLPQLPVQSLGQQSSPVVPDRGIYRTPRFLTDYSNSHLQQIFNGRVPTSLSSNIMLSSQHPQLNGRQSYTVPFPTQAPSGGPTTLFSTDGFRPLGLQSGNIGNTTSEQNWRPAGRMRGALSGEAYAAALKRFKLDSSQSSDATIPSSQTSLPWSFSPCMQ